MKNLLFTLSLVAAAVVLPEVAKAQVNPDFDGRAKLAMDAFKAYTAQEQNARMGAHAAAARLKANNGNDQAMINYIASYYDNLSPGQPGYWTSLSSVAWVVGKYWDKFTPAQLENLKTRVKGLSNLVSSGTENHTLNYQVAGYLFAQHWPNETGWHGGRTSAQLMSQTRTNLLNIMSSLYSKGLSEDLSTTYVATHLSPYFILYDCATDPEVKSAADAAITFHVSHIAASHFEGVVAPPFNRQNAPQFNKHNGGSWNPVLQWTYWLYWGEVQNRVPTTSNFRTNHENRWFIHAALSDWRPPAAINSLAFGQTVPYELTSTKCNHQHFGAGGAGEYERYVYRDRLYAMGSGNMRFRPNGYHLDYNMFGLIYKSGDTFNYIDCHHDYWRSNHRIWTGASPFIQTAQHKGTAIVLFNIPATDPWHDRGPENYRKLRDNHFNSLIQEGLARYPKSIDEKVESSGWIFLREGDVYIAIRPLNSYTIDPNYYTNMTKPGDHLDHIVNAVAQYNVVRSPHAKTGFLFDVGTRERFASFQAFQTAVRQNPLTVDLNSLSVTYRNSEGDTLSSTWRAPVPDYKDVPNSYNQNVSAQVWVRPNFTVNGTNIPIDSDFTGAKAVIKSPSMELVNRVLRLKTPAGALTVDWSNPNPVFSETQGPTYTVAYNANGATSGTAPASQTKTHDVALTLATNSGNLTRTGFTFAGWNTAADGSGTNYAAGGTYTGNANLSLFARWTASAAYSVTYNANGATSGTSPADQIKTHDVDLTLATNSGNLARSGFTFAGWNTATDGSGTNYAAGSTYTGNANLALFAGWTDLTSTWNLAGGGGWGTAGNWNPSGVPGGIDAVVNLTNNITSNASINLNGGRTVGTLNIGDANGTNVFNINNSSGNILTFEVSSGSAALNLTSTHSLSSKLTTNISTINSIRLGSDLVLGNHSPTGGIHIQVPITESGGDRTLTLAGAGGTGLNTFSRPNSFSRLVVRDNMIFNNANAAVDGIVDDLAYGKVPASYTADAITLDGGGLRAGGNAFHQISANRGITLGEGGGRFLVLTPDRHFVIDSVIAGTSSGGPTVEGSGSVRLNAANTYDGDTTVNGGTLILGHGNAIPSAGRLVIDGGKVDPAGNTVTVGSLFFGEDQQLAGTWGSSASTATHTNDTHFAGTGVVSVTDGPGGPATYYTVTYNANEATSGTVPDEQTKDGDVDLMLATNSGNLARTGFSFAGWNTAADGSGTNYAEGESYTANADVTLHAKWTAEHNWLPTASGTQLWATAGNWDPASVPSAAGAVVNFTADLAGSQPITMGSTRTVGTLNLGLSGNTFRYNFSNVGWILKANAGDTFGTATINVNNDVSSGEEHILQGGIQMAVENVNLNINSAGGELMFVRNFTDNDGDGTRSPTMTLGAVAGASVFEFRNTTSTTSRNQWGKLVVNQHAIFRNRDATDAGGGTATDRSLGIVISSYLADAITLNGGTLQTGADLNYNISANRGITLGALGGTLNANGASRAWTVDSIITGTGGLTAAGDGNKTLNAANDYTGTTTVSAGTLILGASGSIANSSTIDVKSGATFDVSAVSGFTVGGSQTLMGGGTVAGDTIITGTLAPGASAGTLTFANNLTLGEFSHLNFELNPADTTPGSEINDLTVVNGDLVLEGQLNVTATSGDFLGLTSGTWRLFNYAGTLNDNGLTLDSLPALAPGYGWSLDTTTANQVNLTITPPEPGPDGYPTWAALNNAGPNLNDDHDNDGVPNGVEWFLVGPNTNSTGFTALPGVTHTAGTFSVTWTKSADYPGTYGTDFRVETTETLATGSWTTETLGGNVTITGNDVKYTFPAGSKNFARLVITGP